MIDETGLKILSILQDKARIPNVEVARQVGMAPSAVLERIRKLEKTGIIDGYEVRLNPERFNRRLLAFVNVQTDMQTGLASVGESLAAVPEVQEVHFIAGEDGYLIKVRVSDTGELQSLLETKILSIPAVRSLRTSIVMTTLKETYRIPLGEIDANEDTR